MKRAVPGLMALLILMIAGCGAPSSGTGSTQQPPAPPSQQGNNSANQQAAGCWHSPVELKMMGLQHVPCAAAGHVGPSVKVTYATEPPLSGDHWANWLPPGFYTAPQAPEQLVHDLEHGNIVIYYDAKVLPAADMDQLKALTRQFSQDFQGVLAVPRTDATAPLILTAWENMLKLQKYDATVVAKFVDSFRGRGPEQQVR